MILMVAFVLVAMGSAVLMPFFIFSSRERRVAVGNLLWGIGTMSVAGFLFVGPFVVPEMRGSWPVTWFMGILLGAFGLTITRDTISELWHGNNGATTPGSTATDGSEPPGAT